MGDLLHKLADTISPKPLFVIEAQGLERLTLAEAIGSYLRCGLNPLKANTVLVASGGSSKGYFTEGFLEELLKQGVVLDRIYTTSVTSLLALTEFHELATLRDFSRQVPDLIHSRITRGFLRKEGAAMAELTGPAIRMTGAAVKSSWGYLSSLLPFPLWQSSPIKELPKTNGLFKMRTNYLFDTTALDERLRVLCRDEYGHDRTINDLKKFNIVATDYRDKRVYVLNKQYPDMPLWVAIRGSMALPQLIQPTVYVDSRGHEHPIFDGGISHHFPFLEQEIKNEERVIGIILGYHSAPEERHDYCGNRGALKDMIAQAEIRNFETITTAMRLRYGVDLDDFVNHSNPRTAGITDSKGLLYLSIPHNPESPSFTIHIPMDDREAIYLRGREEALTMLCHMRRPYALPNASEPVLAFCRNLSASYSTTQQSIAHAFGSLSNFMSTHIGRIGKL